MRVGEWVGKYQLVYIHNDPMFGITYKWADGDFVTETHHIPTEQELDEGRFGV